jgi:hypothetical protein
LVAKRYWRTTIGVAGVRVADDLVDRAFTPARANQLWCADIKYVRSWQGWLYLAAVIDCYSQRIVGWMSSRRPLGPREDRGPTSATKGGPMDMVYAAIDIHKQTLHAAVLDAETGAISERRFAATGEEVRHWAMPLRGEVSAIAIEATTGWRWIWRELSALGLRRPPRRSGTGEGAAGSEQAREDRST